MKTKYVVVFLLASCGLAGYAGAATPVGPELINHAAAWMEAPGYIDNAIVSVTVDSDLSGWGNPLNAQNMLTGGGGREWDTLGSKFENPYGFYQSDYTLPQPAITNPAGVACKAWVEVDFSQAFELARLDIWNHNQIGVQTRGFKDFTIHVYNAGVWTQVGGSYVALIAPGAWDYAHDWAGGSNPAYVTTPGNNEFDLLGMTGSKLLISAQSNWGDVSGMNMYGLSDLRVYTTPEPVSALLLGLGFLGLRHRRKA